MSDGLIQHSRRTPVDLVPVTAGEFKTWLKGRSAKLRRWIKSADFNALAGTTCLVPNAE